MYRQRVIGILREVKGKWERRVPLVPEQVDQLTRGGIKVLIQPSERRIFTDDEFRKAGAIVTNDLTPANCIFGVKEFPLQSLIPNKSYMIFSHTIKAQLYNMPFLDACLAQKVRLFDYECIRQPENEGGQRLVAFGKYAGVCGMIDCLRGFGARLLALGYSTPFMGAASSYMYPSVVDAQEAVAKLGREIARVGVPKALAPMVFVFTGTGNVTKGALDIFKLLPHEFVEPHELPTLAGRADRFKVYGCIVTAKDMVAPVQPGATFNKADYYANPQSYRPVFHETVAPYTSVLVNGMYWDAKYPRLLTLDQAEQLETTHPGAFKMVADISCDIKGSVEYLVRSTTLDQPFYIYDPITRKAFDDIDGRGVMMLGVDNLPTSVPREASRHFSEALAPFVPALAEQDPSAPFDAFQAPAPIRNACIASNGALTPGFQYIAKLRAQNEKAAAAASAATSSSSATSSPAASTAAAAGESADARTNAVLLIQGHLFDSGLINHVLDLLEVRAEDFKVLHWDIGPNRSGFKQTSSAVIQVRSSSADAMQSMLTDLHALTKLTPASQASIQQLPFGGAASAVAAASAAAGSSKPTAVGAPATPATASSSTRASPTPASSSSSSAAAASLHVTAKGVRRVLVLGSGYVAAPVVDYLTQPGRGNEVTVASLELAAAQRLCAGNAAARPLLLNAQDAAAVDAAVKQHDFVISLLPATAHVPIAKACIAHRRSMVTASYISPDMRRLNAEAARAGVCIMNEIGLDPGIDHMSAMQIIDGVRDAGGRVVSFESMCGGLPAPEAADNPLAYKFSWSPRGVLMAAQNAAKYRRDGRLVEIEGKNLLAAAAPVTILPALSLEHLPNRDSMQYGATYRIDRDESGGAWPASGADTIYRGTLRYRGFSELMLAFSRLGLLDLQARTDIGTECTWRELVAQLVGASGPNAQVARGVHDKLAAAGLSAELQNRTLEACQWLGLLSDRPVQWRGTVMDTFCALLQEKLAFGAGERDMVLLYHRFVVEHADHTRERITSTLLSYGEAAPGYSAMARTVGFPAAVAAQYMMEGVIARKGVIDPTPRDVYIPILKELQNYKINCVETATKIDL